MLIFFNKFSSILHPVFKIYFIFSIIFDLIPSLLLIFKSPIDSYNLSTVSITSLILLILGDAG